MIQYTIQFELHPEKVTEFQLSWNRFYENIKETEGLEDCSMFDLGENSYQIMTTWTEPYYLKLFKSEEWHRFIRGAVNVLGEKSVITQKEVQED